MKTHSPGVYFLSFVFAMCLMGTNASADTPDNCDELPNCCEVTSSLGGTVNSGTLLRALDNQINKPDGGQCQFIVVTVNHIDPLQTGAVLLPGTTLYGNGVTLRLHENISSNKHFGCVVDMRASFIPTAEAGGHGAAQLEEITIAPEPLSYKEVHGVCMRNNRNVLRDVTIVGAGDVDSDSYAGVFIEGERNTLDTVTVENVPFGLHLADTASNNTVFNSIIQDALTGVLVHGDQNRFRGSTVRFHQQFGFWLIGDQNKVGIAETHNGVSGEIFSPVTIRNNTLGGVIVATGTQNRIARNAIYDNGGEGIILYADGNDNFTRPRVRAVYNSFGSQWALVGLVPDTTQVVEYFVADNMQSGEGKEYKGTADRSETPQQFPTPAVSDGEQLFYTFVKPTDVPVSTPVVATAAQTQPNASSSPVPNLRALNTSAFSAPFVPSSNRISTNGDVEDCFAQEWFVESLEIVLKTDFEAGSPWAHDFDGDGRTNGEEDANRDCEHDAGETDPAVPDTEDDTTPDGDLCAALPPSYCTDSDGDGVNDNIDNCVDVPNADQADFDDPDGDGIAQGNGVGDVCEDIDDDGIPNHLDNCPTIANSDQADLDADTAGDVCDFDIDNDGLMNGDEALAGTDPRHPDTDGDGRCDGHGWGYGFTPALDTRCAAPDDNCPSTINPNQRDTDEDGIGDACDIAPEDYLGELDSDGDGRSDRNDSCPHVADDGLDFDSDGAANACDSDDDNDGLEDWIESGMTHWIPAAYVKDGTQSPHGAYVPLSGHDADSDDDGLCDGPVAQVDGVCIGFDNCPDHYESLNPGVLHADAEGDGVGDICADFVAENDGDGDGLVNANDNCPLLPNREQINLDSDFWIFDAGLQRNTGGGNGCDPDADNDGADDTFESGDRRLHPWEPDSDHYSGDGYDDYCDGDGRGYNGSTATRCLPKDNCPVFYNPDQADGDENGIGDECDALGEGDRDKDGIPDSEDNCPDFPNPDQADLDRDGIGDLCDDDLDGDGVVNVFDNCPSIPNPDQDDVCGPDFSLGPVEFVNTTHEVELEGGLIPGGCTLIQ